MGRRKRLPHEIHASTLHRLELALRKELAEETNKWLRLNLYREIKALVVEQGKVKAAYNSGQEAFMRMMRLEAEAAAKSLTGETRRLTPAEREVMWAQVAEQAVARRMVEAEEAEQEVIDAEVSEHERGVDEH